MSKEKIYVVTHCENREDRIPNVFTNKETAIRHMYQAAMEEFIDRGYLDIAKDDPDVRDDIAHLCAGIYLHDRDSVMANPKRVLIACSECLTDLIEVSPTGTTITIDAYRRPCVFKFFETELK